MTKSGLLSAAVAGGAAFIGTVDVGGDVGGLIDVSPEAALMLPERPRNWTACRSVGNRRLGMPGLVVPALGVVGEAGMLALLVVVFLLSPPSPV